MANDLWSISRLADEFGMDRRTVKSRLDEVKPTGVLNKNPAWSLKDAAPFLVDQLTTNVDGCYDVSELPPDLKLKHYQAERERLKLEIDLGDVIPLNVFQDVLADSFKTFAQMMDTFPDVLERDCNIGADALEAVQKTIDEVRTNLHKKMINDSE
jgi:hypothetical protein